MKLFQITEDDLAELEHTLPDLCDAVAMRPEATSQQRTQIRRVRRIISDVRWNYGPPEQVERIDAGDVPGLGE
jgi:hypothetical protein